MSILRKLTQAFTYFTSTQRLVPKQSGNVVLYHAATGVLTTLALWVQHLRVERNPVTEEFSVTLELLASSKDNPRVFVQKDYVRIPVTLEHISYPDAVDILNLYQQLRDLTEVPQAPWEAFTEVLRSALDVMPVQLAEVNYRHSAHDATLEPIDYQRCWNSLLELDSQSSGYPAALVTQYHAKDY